MVAADALRARLTAVLTTSVAAARSSLLLDLARDAAVGHIPFPLVRTLIEPGTGPAASASAAAHRAGGDPIRPMPPSLPADARIAVVVPSRDNARDVEILAASLRATAEHAERLDILVLDNGGTDPGNRVLLDRLAARGQIRRIVIDEPFNWSRLNNLGAALSDAPLLVFANDDMRMLTRAGMCSSASSWHGPKSAPSGRSCSIRTGRSSMPAFSSAGHRRPPTTMACIGPAVTRDRPAAGA